MRTHYAHEQQTVELCSQLQEMYPKAQRGIRILGLYGAYRNCCLAEATPTTF